MKCTAAGRKVPAVSCGGLASAAAVSTGAAVMISILRPAWAAEQMEQEWWAVELSACV